MSECLARLYGTKIPPFKNCFGVEFELENCLYNEETAVDNDNVSIKEDASLRNNGLEFVTIPIKYNEDGFSTLKKIRKDILSSYPGASSSFRAGTHVHINVGDLLPQQLYRLLILYYIIEPILYSVCGDRSDNLFCVPWRGSTVESRMLVSHWDDTCSSLNHIIRDSDKYCGLNVRTVNSLGSIECRILPSNLWEESVVEELIEVLHILKEKAKRDYHDAQHFHQSIYNINTNSSYEEVIKIFFPENLLGVSPNNIIFQKAVKLGVFKYKLSNINKGLI